jgi:hypothetical protein
MEYDFFEDVILEAGYAEVQTRALERGFFNGVNADFACFGVGLCDCRVGVMPESVAKLQRISICRTADADGVAAFIFVQDDCAYGDERTIETTIGSFHAR